MYKILIADDAPSVLSNISKILKMQGYEVVEATDGVDALEKAFLFTPDLIISDIMMPRKSGIEFLIELRENTRFAQTPFIFLSARMDLHDIRLGMNVGAEDYLTKPFRAKELIDAVETQLRKKELAATKLREMYQGITLYIPHELRTPLVGILGYADILTEDWQNLDEEYAKKMLSGIKRLSQRLYKRLDKFIVFANAELLLQNPSMLNSLSLPKTQDAAHTVRLAAENLSTLYNRKPDLHISLDNSSLDVPEEFFKIMVEELVDNAFKFSSAGNIVVITGTTEGTAYKLVIHNEGRGMSEEEFISTAPHLQHDRENLDQDGNGLGLITTLKLAKLFNITYSFEGNKGSFAKFSLVFKM